MRGTAAGDIWKLCGHFRLPAFWMQQVSLMIAPWFRFRKVPWFSWLLSVAAGFPATSTINPPKCASFSLPWELDAASGFEFLVALVRFRCRCFWVSSGFSTQSDGSRMRNVSRQVRPGSSLAYMLQSCLLLFDLVSSSPSSWSSLSSWNSWCSKGGGNGWCWTNEEDCSAQHVWNSLQSTCLRVGVSCQSHGFEFLGPD